MKKLDELKQTNGALDENREGLTNTLTRQGRSYIRKVMGVEINPFGSETHAEYADYIRSLDTPDLDKHATEIGLRPIDDKRILRERCVGMFDEFMAKRRHLSAKTHVSSKGESSTYKNLRAVKIARG